MSTPKPGAIKRLPRNDAGRGCDWAGAYGKKGCSRLATVLRYDADGGWLPCCDRCARYVYHAGKGYQ